MSHAVRRTAILLVLFVLLPAAAAHAGPVATVTLTVSPDEKGSVSGGGFSNCRSVCSVEVVKPFGDGVKTLILTATPDAGWTSGWQDNKLTLTITQNSPDAIPVTAALTDIANPTVTAQPQLGGGARAFPGMELRASASDNSGTVSKVEYLINGTVRGSSTNSGNSFAVSLDASPFEHGAPLSIVARATDPSNRTASSTAVNATMDKRADATFGDAAPADGTATAATSVAYPFTVASDVTIKTCLLDGAVVEQVCTSPFDVSPQTDGPHTVTVRATDNVGNTTDWSRTLVIDRSKPVIAFGDVSAPLPAQPRTVVPFAVTDTTAVTLSCKVDGNDPVPCTDGSSHTMTGLGDGAHTLAVTATDALGNAETGSTPFTVDATAPALELTEGPAEGAAISAKAVTFKFNTEPGTTISCSLDGDNVIGNCSGANEDHHENLAEGEHTFRVRSVDGRGNAATVARKFIIDTVAPVLRITGGPAQDSTFRDRVADFTFESEPGAVLACRADGGGLRACSSPTGDRIANLADGAHTFTVQATDRAGNVASVRRSFKVVPSREVRGTLTRSFLRRGANTTVVLLSLKGLSPGAKVTLSCKGGGCPKRKSVLKPRRNAVNMASKLRGRRLRPGAVITIRIDAPGFLGRTTKLTIRRGKDPKAVTTTDKEPT